MQHLLGRDVQDHLAPTLDGRELFLAQPGPLCSEAERGVEVLAHRRVLELGGQAQKVGQLFAPPPRP